MKIKDLVGIACGLVIIKKISIDGDSCKREVLYIGFLSQCPQDFLELKISLLFPESKTDLVIEVMAA